MLKSIFGRNGKSEPTGLNVLVVDDSEIERKVMKKILETNGYGVLTAEDGESALSICREKKPDLVFLDIGLPDIMGPSVSRRLKMDEATQRIPIVFITGDDTPKNVIDSFDFGAESYLAKPINAKILIQHVRQALEDIKKSA